MGVDRITYIGPFLVCKYEGEEPDQYDMYELVDEAMAFPLGDTLAEQMTQEKVHIYLPNRGFDHSVEIAGRQDAQVHRLSTEFINESISEFLHTYGRLMNLLKPHYTKMAVKFGVIHQVY